MGRCEPIQLQLHQPHDSHLGWTEEWGPAMIIEAWVIEYNELRPHRGLGMKTPMSSPEKLRWAGYESHFPPCR